MKRAAEGTAGVSPAAVREATGKTWAQWLVALDKAGAMKRSHRENADWLQARHKLPAWWAQIVTVSYEQARGLRAKPHRPDGFEVSVSRTISAPVAAAFEAWKDPALREKWLPHTPMSVRKATPHKSIRITWGDGTNLSVNFWPKGPLKCQVVPQHGQLPDAATAEKLKAYWSERLEALQKFLEKK